MDTKILIVEDEGIIAQDLADILGRHGYRITGFARTGAEAFALAQSGSPDLIFMDIMLDGGMDGIEAAGSIMAALDIPVVFITAHAERSLVQRAKSVNPYGYLLKPFREEEIDIVIQMGLERHRLVRMLRQSEARFRELVASIPDIVYSLDREGRIVTLNRDEGLEELFGLRRADAVGRYFLELIHPDDREMVARSFGRAITERREYTRGLELWLAGKDGAEYWYELHAHMSFDAKGEFDHEEGVLRDITERKAFIAELERTATFDAMTGAYNRRSGLMMLGMHMRFAKRRKQPLTVCFADADGLKYVNDGFGHAAGDGLIIAAANALRKAARESDVLCRMGGDEFMLVMPGCDAAQARNSFEERFGRMCARAGEEARWPYPLSVSTGYAEYDYDADMTVDQLVDLADHAMYRNKRNKKEKDADHEA